MTTLAPELDRARLVEDNLDLLRQVAWFQVQRGLIVSLDDLIADGFIGLCRAADCFDPELGVPFRLYAWRRISGAMLDGVRRRDPVARNVRKRATQIDKARHRFAAREHRFPSVDELATELGWIARDVLAATRQMAEAGVLSLDEPVRQSNDDDAETRTLADMTPDPDADTEREAFAQIDRDRLPELLARLTARERMVIGLSLWEGVPLREIGVLLGVTESRICQIRARALERLRDMVAGEIAA